MSFEELKRDNAEAIKAGLKALGQLCGNGAPFALECSPSDVALEKRVAEYNTDMYESGTLYQTILENVTKLHENLSALDSEKLAQVGQACSKRVLRFVIEDNGGTCAAKCMFRDGRFDLVFHAQALKLNHRYWDEVGNDVAEVISEFKLPPPPKAAPAPAAVGPGRAPARAPPRGGGGPAPATRAAPAAPASPFGAMGEALRANLEASQAGITEKLAALTDLVGDGAPWRFELADSAAKMDKAVAAEADWMVNQLFGTIVEFLDGIANSVRNADAAEMLASASPARTIVFEFVGSADDCPRRFLGAMQSVCKGDKLHFVGVAANFFTGSAGWGRIGGDIDKALQAKSGDSGPTEREKKLAESLGAIAASSSKKSGDDDGGGEGGGGWKSNPACNMCKGTGKRVCNHCSGKGGGCKPCGGTGWSARFKCVSSKHK